MAPQHSASLVSFERLQAGDPIVFEPLTVKPFPAVSTYGATEPQADVFAFTEALYERLEGVSGKKIEHVQLYYAPGRRGHRIFAYLFDRNVWAVELRREPTLDAWLSDLTNPFGGSGVLGLGPGGTQMSPFSRWDELENKPAHCALEHPPRSYNKEKYDREKEAYFAFEEPTPADRAFSQERFDRAIATFLESRSTTASASQDEVLTDLSDRIGVPLPGDLRALYETTGSLPKVFFGYDLMSPRQVVQEWENWQEIYEDWNLDDLLSTQRAEAGVYPVYVSPRWVPFIDLNANFLAVDLGPAAGGSYGQVIVFGADVDSKRKIAGSVTELLEKAATYDGDESHELYSVFGALQL